MHGSADGTIKGQGPAHIPSSFSTHSDKVTFWWGHSDLKVTCFLALKPPVVQGDARNRRAPINLNGPQVYLEAQRLSRANASTTFPCYQCGHSLHRQCYFTCELPKNVLLHSAVNTPTQWKNLCYSRVPRSSVTLAWQHSLYKEKAEYLFLGPGSLYSFCVS